MCSFSLHFSVSTTSKIIFQVSHTLEITSYLSSSLPRNPYSAAITALAKPPSHCSYHIFVIHHPPSFLPHPIKNLMIQYENYPHAKTLHSHALLLLQYSSLAKFQP